MYQGLDFDRGELSSVMKNNYEDIIEFIAQPVFQSLFIEMMNLQPNERPSFVNEVWLNSDELKKRGLDIPAGILIQTSAFGDRRPTLFVVKKFLPEKYHRVWENVNWTFNNDFKDEEVPSDPENSWRLPLTVSAQNALLTKNIDLQSIPNDNEFSQKLFTGEIINSEKRNSIQ
jgi:hypothetical protein